MNIVLKWMVLAGFWFLLLVPGGLGEDLRTRAEAEVLVEQAYLDVLHRHPEPRGLTTHVDLLLGGMPIENLRSALAESGEGKRVTQRVRRRTGLLLFPGVILSVFLLVVFIRSGSGKEFVFKTILLFLSLGVACLVAEMALRAQASWRSQQTTEAWKNIEGAKRPNTNALVTLKDVIHLSANSNIIYEMFPNLDVRFLGRAMHTDGEGFRVTPGSEETPDAFRIVGLGDSVMFGWGVADEETYLSHLCGQWKQKKGGPVAVWNTCVPGYNTTMEVETLEAKLLSKAPNLVLLHYVDNDLGLPNFIPQKDESVRQTKSLLIAAVSGWRGGRKRAATFERLVRRKGPTPEAYAHMVGESACSDQIRRLASLSAHHGFDVVVICNWAAPDFLAAVAEDVGIPIIELGGMIRRYREESQIKGFQGSVLTVSQSDPHYSALAHELIADEVLRRLQEEGLY